jgi:hypothetical protein
VEVVILNAPGYLLQGVAAYVFGSQEESTVPFYRLASASGSDNFYTISETERASALANGYAVPANNPVTYIYPTQICGSVPLYRLFHAAKIDNFYTTLEWERQEFIADGYTYIEIAGYVLPATAAQCG